MADKTITIYDIAEKADVSLTTVSRVFNHPEKVKKETMDKILRVIQELDFHPNALAKSLASKKTRTIGVIVSDLTNIMTAHLFNGILDISYQFDYSIKIYHIIENGQVIDVANKIIADRIDGLIYVNEELSEDYIYELQNTLLQNNIPTVFANVSPQTKDISVVRISYTDATYQLTKKLINNGNKNIYFVKTKKVYALDKYKERGYLQAISEFNLTPLVIETSEIAAINFAHFKEYFTKHDVDACVVASDPLALSVVNALKENGKSIPEVVEVASCQNSFLSELSQPTITSIDLPVYDIGAVSMRLLTKLIDDNHEPQSLVLPSKIIIRGSTKFKE